MKILAYTFWLTLILSPFWVPFVLLMWFFGAFDSCHTTLIVTCP